MNDIIFLGFADNKIPEFKEVKSKDWILFGEDNKFPEHLIYLYNKSSNHNAIINGKVTYILGKGLPTNPVVNRYNETLNKVLKKFTIDVELFGGGRFEVVWKMNGTAEIYHIPFQSLRRHKERNGFWYRKSWDKIQSQDDKPIFIPDFDPNNKVGKQIFYYNEYRPGCDEYPLPSYLGALNDIETDVEISIYNLSVMKNGQFSGKLVSFFNGEPTEEERKRLERKWNDKFNGSGNAGKTMLSFNKNGSTAPQVDDLSATDLDKLFEQLNKTVQAEIFSGHQITSPMLFGIMEPGKLGGRNEILDSYEIFKNTYINDKQQALEEVIKVIAPLVGGQVEKLIPVDPLTVGLNAVDFKDMLPEAWVFEKLGIDPAKYPATTLNPSDAPVNENLKNLTGRQFQQLQRVLTKYKNGKLTQQEATLLLRNSYGLNDEDITCLLSEQFSSDDFDEFEVAAMFEACGEAKKDYTVVKSMKFDKQEFADLSQIDSDIVNLISKDKRITPKVIAETIKSSPEYVTARIKTLQESGVLREISSRIGVDTIIERAINPEVIEKRPKPETVDVYVKYSYEVKKGAGAEIISTTRPFCKKLIELDRLYTRGEIEQISQRVGYSVFDRSGGWWGSRPQCRHEWRRNIVIKKR